MIIGLFILFVVLVQFLMTTGIVAILRLAAGHISTAVRIVFSIVLSMVVAYLLPWIMLQLDGGPGTPSASGTVIAAGVFFCLFVMFPTAAFMTHRMDTVWSVEDARSFSP